MILYASITLIVVAAIFLIGYIFKKTSQSKQGIVGLLVEVFKFILTTESLTLPGRVNGAFGVLIIILSLVLVFPLIFSVIYQALFGKAIINVDKFYYVFIYFAVCGLGLSFIEAIIRFKENNVIIKK